MSFTSSPAVVPDRDNLPLKKRDQRWNPPPPQQHQQQQCDAATFKAPYPHKSHSEIKFKHTGPFQPVPKRVPALYQPWMHTQTSSGSKPHILSAFRKHQGWADTNPLPFGWNLSHPFQHHSHLSGTSHKGYPHHPSRFSPISPINEGFQGAGGGHGWEQLKTLRDNNLNPEWQSNGRYRGLHVRRRERKVEHFSKGVKATCSLLSLGLPHSPDEDLTLQQHVVQKSTELIRHPISEHSFTRDDKSHNTYTSIKEDTLRSLPLTSSEQASFSSSSPNCFPWLLPHFVAGSLIELGDGRLRRVEHLQTEDFLLGSQACPDLRLSCCTVQSITPSTSSYISRLLILLHDQPSQVKRNSTCLFLEIMIRFLKLICRHWCENFHVGIISLLISVQKLANTRAHQRRTYTQTDASNLLCNDTV